MDVGKEVRENAFNLIFMGVFALTAFVAFKRQDTFWFLLGLFGTVVGVLMVLRNWPDDEPPSNDRTKDLRDTWKSRVDGD